jgi:hypothetical protein
MILIIKSDFFFLNNSKLFVSVVDTQRLWEAKTDFLYIISEFTF